MAIFLALVSQARSENIVATQAAWNLVNNVTRPMATGLYDSVSGKTFIVWPGENMKIYVNSYDHSDGCWGIPQGFTGAPAPSGPDNHNYPAIVQSDDGHLNIFYTTHHGSIYQLRSPYPRTVSGTWASAVEYSGVQATYPMPVVLDDGRIFLFYRDRNSSRNHPIHLMISDDDGETFGSPINVIDFDRTDQMNTIYLAQVTHKPAVGSYPERLLFSWVITGPNPPPNTWAQGSYYGSTSRNVYYAWLHLNGNTLRSPNWTILGDLDTNDPIDEGEADAYCLVEDTGAPTQDGSYLVNLLSIPETKEAGSPVVFYYTTPESGSAEMQIARWVGTGWAKTTISGAPLNDVDYLGSGDFRVYGKSGQNFREYVSTDDGVNWSTGDLIDLRTDLFRCFLIEDYHPELKLWMTSQVQDFDGNSPLYVGATSPVQTIGVEAEDGAVTGTASIVTVSDANGHEVVKMGGTADYSFDSGTDGDVAMSFYIAHAGAYQLLGNVSSTGGSSDSFFVTVDGGSALAWHFGNTGGDFDYLFVSNGGVPVTYYFTVGWHEVRVWKREPDAMIDTMVMEPVITGTLEAEAGAISGTASITNEGGTSGGQVVKMTGSHQYTFGSGTDGYVDFEFYVGTAADYKIVGFVASDDSSSDSFFVTVNGQAELAWHFGSTGGTYAATYVTDNSNPVTFSFDVGFHSIRIWKREANARIDTIELEAQ